MATNDRASAQGQEEGYEEGQDEGIRQEPGSERDEGQEDLEDAADAALDVGEEQEAGGEDDLEPPSRGSNRIQRLANENAELKRQLADRQPAPQYQGPREETAEEFAARVSLLSPDERMEARLARSERNNAQQLQFLAFQSREAADKSAYETKAVYDPRYKRYAEAVEAKQQELLRQGQWNTREAILKYLLGERILSGQGQKEVKRQRQQGEQRIARQQTKPSGGRSDVQGGGGRRQMSEREARARRLDGVDI